MHIIEVSQTLDLGSISREAIDRNYILDTGSNPTGAAISR